MSLFSLTVQDEESTIEEQEAMEVTADQKAELGDLAKDGQHDALFSLTIISDRFLPITFVVFFITHVGFKSAP